MTDPQDPVARLHATLGRRDTPEAVAEIVRQALPPASERRLRAPLSAVIGSSVQARFGWSSMATAFLGAVPMDRQVAKARELAELFLGGQLPDADDPDALEAVVAAFNALILKAPGRDSFKHDRLGREVRVALGPGLSRRRYGKLFRLAGRLERRLARLRAEEAKHRLILVSKAALAPDLSLDDLGGHGPTAAFVAYYAARMKLRSEFTIAGQQRPFDALAAALLALCEEDPETRWFAIAHVFPRADVLARLTDEQKGRLLGRWFGILRETAERLEAAHTRTHIDLTTMVVRRGNDSTTWNLLAGAWNRARDHWMALVDALDLEGLFDEMLPGKVMRLMAADVAAWHRSTGGSIHPDTLVWAELPKPWAVLRGEATCTRTQIEAACRRHGLDVVKSGWTAPRPRTAVAEFRPTPELVHGVTVNNPHLASLLRRVGAFSGKPLRLDRLREGEDGGRRGGGGDDGQG